MKLSMFNPLNLLRRRDVWVAKQRQSLNEDIDKKLAMWGDYDSDYHVERRARAAAKAAAETTRTKGAP